VYVTIPVLYLGLLIVSGIESTDCWNGWGLVAELRMLVSAQEEFRRTDADRNGIQDYWRRDVAGLYTMVLDGRPLKFITLTAARADPRSIVPPPDGRRPYYGWWIEAIGFADEKTPDPRRFAYCAWPEDSNTSEWVFVVSHQGEVFAKRFDRPETLKVFPADPRAEGWRTTDRLRKDRWRSRNPLWWVRFWDAL